MSHSFGNPEMALSAYETWLERQPLSENTRRTYSSQVSRYCDYLAGRQVKHGDPLNDPHARNYAVRDYKTYIKKKRRSMPSTVNLALAAIDHFYRFLGLGDADVRREELPQQAPRALEPEQQVAFLRAIERCPSTRDQAIAVLLFYTGIRLGECANLDMDDVRISARKGVVIIRSGKGDAYREVPLNAQARKALDAWLAERGENPKKGSETALFLNRQGQRLSTRSIDTVVRKQGGEVGLTLSAHVLRHTCLTNLVRKGHDLVLVADIAGHKRLETTRRYSLPSEKDRAAAMEDIQVEH